MIAERRTSFWLAFLAAVAILLWLLSPILLPFALGMAMAYVVAPLVARLERIGLSRAAVSAAIIFGFSGAIVLVLLLLLPVLVEQVTGLAERLPDLVAWGHRALLPVVGRLMAKLGAPVDALPSPSTAEIVQRAAGVGGQFVKRLVSEGFAVVNLLSLLCLTPLVAFYLLRDWPKMIATVDGLLPREHAGSIRAELREIDRVLAAFARGSAVVCLVQGAFYATTLTLIGLDFGLVIGLTAGAVSFVPYLGMIFGFVSSVGVALYQFWPDWPRVALVAGLFLSGEALQDYVLAPRLIGHQVGLHPLWMIFGVLGGGALFGFAGVLLAVPTCAVIGVLVRFGIERYKASTVYATTDGTADRPAPRSG